MSYETVLDVAEWISGDVSIIVNFIITSSRVVLLILSFVFFLYKIPGASVLAIAAVVGWVWSIFQTKARLDIFDDD